MRVVFLHHNLMEDPAYDPNEERPPGFPVVEALKRLGHEVTCVPCTLNLREARNDIEKLRPDVIFNHVESLGGSDQLLGAAALLLDAMQIPYTGCPAEALVATTGKLSTKRRLREVGLPTPPWVEANGSGWPELKVGQQMIVKPVYEHESFKMGDESVLSVSGQTQLVKQIREWEQTWKRPYFAEAYIEGREFNISLLDAPGGPQVLPHAEIDFSDYPEDKPRIVGYRAKRDAKSFEYHHTPRRFDFVPSDGPLLDQLSMLSRRCWDLFGLRGYARVDFRVDAEGQPWILEINANPCLESDAGFPAALKRAGIAYDKGIQTILDNATIRGAVWNRPKLPPPL